MSIAVAVNAGRFALLAADCREWTYTDQTLTAIATEGRRSKIWKTADGLLTGTGASRLVDLVAHEMASRDVDRALAAITSQRQEATRWHGEALRQHALTATGFLLTYRPSVGGAGVAVYHPHFSDAELFPLRVGGVIAFMRAASYDVYAEWIETAIRECRAGEDLDASIAVHAALVRELIARYAGEPNAISSAECELAVHLDDGRRLVSPILAPGEALTWSDNMQRAAA